MPCLSTIKLDGLKNGKGTERLKDGHQQYQQYQQYPATQKRNNSYWYFVIANGLRKETEQYDGWGHGVCVPWE
jgi:hypothetical protein